MTDYTPRTAIQQQMYTRERRGIFRSTEGYDTIAKSSGLDSSFVKKVLHPLCVYDAPAELTARGERDNNAYPEALHLIQLDNGEIVLGRSVYQEADFTGLRSTFFTHHYIIPANYDDKADLDYMSLLSAAFVESYSIELGTEIEQLPRLPQASSSKGEVSSSELLTKLGIGEREFKALLHAVMASLGGKKKVYISLPVPIGELSNSAKELLAVLYSCLPHAHRKLLGFMTYSKEPISRKGIHVTFVESSSLRSVEREIEKEFIFDLANDRILNVDLDGLDFPYLNYMWANLNNKVEIEKCCKMAVLMLEDMGAEQAQSPASYHELCVLYRCIEGDELGTANNQIAILSSALHYLSTPGALDTKVQLNDLFLSFFDLEYDKLLNSAIPSQDSVLILRDYYGIAGKLIENKLVAFLIYAISNAIKGGDENSASSFFEIIEGHTTLGKAFFSKIVNEGRFADRLFFPYLTGKLKATSFKGMVSSIVEWGKAFPKLYEYEMFYTIARDNIVLKLAKERYSLGASNQLLEQLKALDTSSKQSNERGDNQVIDLVKELEIAVYSSMLTGLEPEKLTRDALRQATFMSDNERLKRWNKELKDSNQSAVARMLGALYNWFSQKAPNEELFDELTSQEVNRVQGVGRHILSAGLNADDFPQLVLAFLRAPELEVIDYNSLIDFIHGKSFEKETVYRFFIWTESHTHFMRSRGFVPAYKLAIIKYFVEHDPTALKKRSNWKEYFDQSGDRLKAIFKEAQLELSSPLVRMFRKNRSKTLILFTFALGTIMIISGIVMSFSGNGNTNKEIVNVPVTTTSPTPSSETNIADGSNTIVFVEQLQPAVGEKAHASLVFQFKSELICKNFKPEELSIQFPNSEAEKVIFRELTVLGVCKAEGTNASIDTQSTDKPINSEVTTSQVPSTSTTDEVPSDNQNEQYKSRVAIKLGKEMDIPIGSLVWVGDATEPFKVQSRP